MMLQVPKVVGKKIIGVNTIIEYDLYNTGKLENSRVIKSYNFHPDIQKKVRIKKPAKKFELQEEVEYL
jgi:hypothetical protein